MTDIIWSKNKNTSRIKRIGEMVCNSLSKACLFSKEMTLQQTENIRLFVHIVKTYFFLGFTAARLSNKESTEMTSFNLVKTILTH